MTRLMLLGAVLLLMVWSGNAPAADEANVDVFRSAAAQIELHKPTGWHFQGMERALANRAEVELSDEEFQKAMHRNAALPLVVATKHAEPYDSLNPSVQVIARPAGPLKGASPTEILGQVEPAFKRQFADYTSLDGIRETSIGGERAARMTFRYTARTGDGGEFPTRVTMVMVLRGSLVYQFGFSAPPTGSDALADEVEAVLRSVKFLN